MAVLRISIAGLLLALRCWSQPSQAQKEWALATSGVLNELDHRRHDVLGERTAAGIGEDQRILINYWGVRSRDDLLDRIESLYQDRKTKLEAGPVEREGRYRIHAYGDPKTKLDAGWDYPRAIMLARWGYTVGYLTEDEAWKFIWPLAQRLQRTFSSWQELGAAYLTARQAWYASEARDRRFAEYAYMTLVTTSSSPWRKYPWNLDLGNGRPVPPSGDKTATLTIAAHPGGLICERLTIPDRASSASFLPAIEQAAGCRPWIRSERTAGSDWVLDTECVQPGAAKPAQVIANLRLEPVRSALQQEGVTQLFVYVEHPPTGESSLSPPAQNSWFSYGQQIDIYIHWLRDGLPDLTLTYGFSERAVRKFLSAASVWVFSALMLALIMRLWLSQTSVLFRAQLLDSVWLLFRWSFWVAWLSLSIHFHGLEIAGFWSGSEGLGAALRAITWYGSVAWLLRAITELIVSDAAMHSDGSGLTFGRLLMVCLFRSASEAPFAVVVLFLSNPQNPLEFDLLIVLAALAAAAVLLAQHGLKLATGQKGGVVRNGELYDAVFALAKKMSVPLKRLYIQPEDEWRNVIPSTGTRGNLMLPERLIRSVSRREIDAVAAYALLTLKSGYAQHALRTAVPIAFVFLVHAHRSQIFQPGTFLLLGQIVLATEGFISFLRYRRHKRERIQAQLLALTSDAEGWAAAVAHTAQLTGSALSPRMLEKMARTAGVSLERLAMLAESGLPESGSYPVPDFARDRLVVLK
jgi:uncharacterized protein DUF1266